MEKTGENYHSPSILHSDKLTGLNPWALSKWKKGQVRPHELCMCLSLAIKTQWKILVTECMICCGPQKGRNGVPPLIIPMETSTCLAVVFSSPIFQIMSPLIASAGAALLILVLGWQLSFPFFLPLFSTHILLSLSLALFWSEFDKGLVFTPWKFKWLN